MFSTLNRKTKRKKKKLNLKEKKKIYIVEFRFVEVSFPCKLDIFIGFILVLVTFEKCGIYILMVKALGLKTMDRI